ncbi:MAG: GNAT family N-acetyltransferase [Clostridia bacterium]|nr:GNAT family N-acetyltransferase [Clostridia bacterium]
MIRLLTDDKIKEFSDFCENRLTAAVIYTNLLTYGLSSDDSLFWYSEDEKENINAVFSLSDGVFLASTDNDSLRDEIELFSQIVGAQKVSYSTAEYVMQYKDGEIHTAEDITGENIKDTFDVVFENDAHRKAYFEKWYADISHKIRHNLIHGKCIYEDGKCISVAFTSGETDKIAVISAVATLEKYRKQGNGERVVLSLAQSVDKEIYLLSDNKKTAEWYERIGFETI